jgi:FtsP/CotA-like multicopper oxidase with cupredoxin domain
MKNERLLASRREWLKYTFVSGAATAVSARTAWSAVCADQTPVELHEVENTGCGMREEMPLSPLILGPWKDDLPIPKVMAPGWRRIDGTLAPDAPNAWFVRRRHGTASGGIVVPSKDPGNQDAMGDRPRAKNLPHAGTHQLWPGTPGTPVQNYPAPILYHIRLQVAEHRLTSSLAKPLVPINGSSAARALPASTIYGYNGTFPGPTINVEYGRPVLVRFENDLDLNPACLDRQNFGAPDWGFLTHLHNHHTAAESDGNPAHLTENEGGYHPAEWSDNLYLMYPPGGDDREKQSFLWFHDHRMHYTGANVYKGMASLVPHYDPVIDNGDERQGLRLPGVRRDYPDGTLSVDYDIPLALCDCALDDGTVRHRDQHIPKGRLCDRSHPEWWGKLFYTHQNNHGFVGDIFTVNGKAFPVLRVKRRKYRLRFLDASIARCYELWLMAGRVGAFPGQQGQWNFVRDAGGGGRTRTRGQQCMRMTQIAVDGGLLPTPIIRDSIEIWPAKRREFVVDFGHYMDGRSTSTGDVIYLANTMFMPDGRKPVFDGERDSDDEYCVPMLKIIIDGDAEDHSVMPVPGHVLRPMPPYLPKEVRQKARFMAARQGGSGDEGHWVINGLVFDPARPLHRAKRDTAEEWTVENGSGGWTHPMHVHQEVHRTLSRSNSRNSHPDDTGKEDTIALDPGETVRIYRKFRTFAGNYVAHCHQLAHEDHAMMFGWVIEP